MSLRNKTLAAALGFGFVLGGCDAIERVEPRQSVSPEQALSSQAGFEALITSGYDGFQDVDYYGQQFMLVPDALADNLRVPLGTSNRYPSFVANAALTHLTRWGGFYSTINQMNLVLSRIDQLELQAADPQAIRNRIKGEALFIRAMNYFDLVRTHAYEPGREVGGFTQGVIIRTTPTNSVADADFRARSSVSEVYNLIISDLTEAATLLNGTARGSKNFASRASANAALARVQLYAGNWAAAEAAAAAALAQTSASLVTADATGATLLAAWRGSTHPEAIFEIVNTASTDGTTTNVNGSLQSLTDPTRGGFFDAVPTVDLINSHETGDARLALYAPATVGAETFQYLRKYTGTGGATDVDPVPVFRVPEMLLILAEARAAQNNTAGALEALNTLRAARGLAALSGLSGAQIIDAVYRERRVEFAFEGHRFFDLKRRGLDIPKPQSVIGVLPYTDFRILAPLPASEVDNNPLLDQNPGYN